MTCVDVSTNCFAKSIIYQSHLPSSEVSYFTAKLMRSVYEGVGRRLKVWYTNPSQ
jgi:hypothetical protein